MPHPPGDPCVPAHEPYFYPFSTPHRTLRTPRTQTRLIHPANTQEDTRARPRVPVLSFVRVDYLGDGLSVLIIHGLHAMERQKKTLGKQRQARDIAAWKQKRTPPLGMGLSWGRKQVRGKALEDKERHR